MAWANLLHVEGKIGGRGADWTGSQHHGRDEAGPKRRASVMKAHLDDPMSIRSVVRKTVCPEPRRPGE
jgi:hypothetical protein